MTHPPEPQDHVLLTRLEASLWRPETRFDPEYMDRVLHPDFVEFGRSGRVYDRAAILAMACERIEAEIPLPDVRIALVAEDVALVTYTSRVRQGDAVAVGNRSSLWVRTPAGWRLRFHQGTKVAPLAGQTGTAPPGGRE